MSRPFRRRQGVLAPAGFRYVGTTLVPVDREAVARRAMEQAGGEAKGLADRAQAAADRSLSASSAASLALSDARRALEQIQQAIGAGAAALNQQGVDLLSAAAEKLTGAGVVLGRIEAERAAAVEARLLARREAGSAADFARDARAAADLALRRAGAIVGIDFFEFQEDELVIVLTDGRMFRKNVRGPRGYGSSGPAGTDGKSVTNAYINSTGSLIITLDDGSFVNAGTLMPPITLTSRMLAKQPYDDNYRIWFETGLSSYLYIAENDKNAVATDATFRGIRVPTDANGNPSGEVEVNTAFKWSDKSGGSWS